MYEIILLVVLEGEGASVRLWLGSLHRHFLRAAALP